jgi:S1-C subfamily serine protease
VTPLIRFNPEARGVAHEYEISLDNFKRSTTADIAATGIDTDVLKNQGISNLAFFTEDKNIADRAKVTDLGLSEGDGIYVLGFPLGLVEAGQHNFVIVKSGVIARIRDTLAEKRSTFLIDSFVFPGNSGGPVVTKPEAFSIVGTKSQDSAYLIGMVTDYQPYREIAVSAQTQRPRIMFEENSGLADVITIDEIEDMIHTQFKR